MEFAPSVAVAVQSKTAAVVVLKVTVVGMACYGLMEDLPPLEGNSWAVIYADWEDCHCHDYYPLKSLKQCDGVYCLKTVLR
jgi:hypothetical protein